MQRTWKTDRSPAFPMKALGHAQLGAQEGAMLYYLAKEYFSGTGRIVELGAFLGGSASLIGKGLSENPNWDGERRLHSFDVYAATMANMADFIRTRIEPDFKLGDSFLHLFEAQTKDVADTIEIHQGDLLTADWNLGQIEILFVDIAKSAALNRAVFETFFPNLTPGRGLMIHQDFHNPANPWIHTAMGHLQAYFAIEDVRADDSSLFRLLDMPSPDEIREAGLYETLSLDEKIARIDAIIDRYATPEMDQKYLLLSKATILAMGGEKGRAQALLDDTMAAVGVVTNKADDFFWDTRASRVATLCA